MIATPPNLLRKVSVGLVLAGLACLISRGSADEPSVSTNSTKKAEGGVSEEQRQPSRFFRPYRPGETISGRDIFNPKVSPVAPSHAPPPPSSKRNDELLDRQRNWIFLSGDEKKPDAIKEAFGVEDTSLAPRKSVITRFLENKPAGDSKTNLDGAGEVTPGLSTHPLTAGFNFVTDSENHSDPRRSSSLQPLPLEQNLSGFAAERAKYADVWRERYGANSMQGREDKEAESKAFLELFNSRSSVPVGGGITGVPAPISFGVQPVIPGERGFNPAPVPSAFTSSLDPFKEAPRQIVGGSGLLTTESGFNTRSFTPTPPPALKQEAARSVSQPAILPFPKRAF